MENLERAVKKKIWFNIATSISFALIIAPAYSILISPLSGWFDYFSISAIALGVLLLIRLKKPLSIWNAIHEPLAESDKQILREKVEFYTSLNPQEQLLFDAKIQYFLTQVYIKAIDTTLKPEDKLLIAASAVIPVFRFPHWEYHLDTVLVYPQGFNERFETRSEQNQIQGMVALNNVMILSQKALETGFSNPADFSNVGIHEFAHKIDQADKNIDGVPEHLLAQPGLYKRWQSIVHKEIEAIKAGKSDINPYGATSPVEFFAVVSEYFFENPVQMSHKHAELYDILRIMYRQDLKNILSKDFRKSLSMKKHSVGRNSPCPCGSGKKYKRCCLPKAD